MKVSLVTDIKETGYNSQPLSLLSGSLTELALTEKKLPSCTRRAISPWEGCIGSEKENPLYLEMIVGLLAAEIVERCAGELSEG